MKKQSDSEEKKIDANSHERILLSITLAISKAKTPIELLTIIREKVMQLIPFYDTGILIVEKDGLHHYDLAVNFAGWDDQTETNVNLRQQNNLYKVAHPGSYLAYEIDNMEKAQTPIITDWDYVFKNWDHPFFPTLKDAGYRESLVGLLRNEGKTYGTFWLHSIKKNYFKKEQFKLFEDITNVVSVAVSNLLTNEKILEMEREKSVLLEISTAISQISNRESLFKTIINKIQPIFGFVDAALFIVENDLKNYRLWFDTLNKPYIVNEDNPERSVIPLGNPVITYCLEDKPPRIVEIPLMIEFATSMPSIIAWIEASGTQETLVGTLKVRGKVIGCFNAHSIVKGKFNERMLPLYQNVCEQISIAVANILVNEEILEREKEKSELLVISEQMATIRKIDDLLSIITIKLKPIFLFDYSVTTVYSDDKKYLMHMSSNNSEQEKETDNYRHLFGKANTVAETPYEIFLGNEQPTVYTIDYYLKNYPSHNGVKILKDLGIVENVIMTLRYAGKILGTLEFHYCKKGILDYSKFPILQNLSSQVSVAMSNILANDEILNREKEKSILLNISRSLAGIRNREDLLKKFVPSLKAIFSFDDAVITLYDASLKTRRYAHAYSGPPKENFADYKFLHNNVIENNGSPYEEIIGFDGPQIHYMDYWTKRYGNDPGIKIATEFGLVESLYLPLVYGNRLLGTFTLHSKNINNFSEDKLPLYQNLSDQVAVAVANILANEEILDREKEKALLLSLSEDLAAIRNKGDLWKVMMSKVKSILPFNESPHVAVLTPDGKRMRIILIDPSKAVQENESYREKADHSFDYKDRPFELALQAESPKIYTLKYLLDLFPDLDYWGTKVWVDTGIKELLTVQLKHAGKVIGAFLVHSTKSGVFLPTHFNLFKSVADQLATAVANILANEEILEREKEKSVLLKISSQLSLVNDRKQLWTLLSNTLKEIIHFDVGIVATLDPDGESFRVLLSTAPRDMDNNPEYKELGTKTEKLAGSPFEYIFKKEGVFVFSLTELESNFPGYLGLKMMREYGLLHTVGIKLAKGKDFIGQVYFHFNKIEDIDYSKFGLLKSIGEQLSIVVANILANEQIQERAKEKSLQIDVVNAITSTKNKTLAFLNLASLIDKVIPFHTFSIAFPFDIHYLIGFKKDKNGELVEWHNVKEIMDYANIDVEEYQNMLNEIADSGYFSNAHICVGKDHQELCRKFRISALHNECIGTRSALHLPFLFHGQNITVHIYLNSQQEYGFTEKHLNLLQAMVSPISLAMENLFAFEDIESREKEKTILLNLSNAINNIKDKEELWEEMVNQLQPVFGFERDFTFLYLITPDREHYRFFLLNKSALKDQTLAFKDVFRNEFPIKGAPYEQVINKDVWIFAIEDMVSTYPNFRGFKQGLDSGQQQTAIIRLEHGGKIIGSLHLNSKQIDCFKETQIPLLKAIRKQISMAIANIIATDEIERQLLEIITLKKQLEVENEYLQEVVDVAYNYSEIIGTSKEMQNVFRQVSQVASTDSTVLILGETGTGKELIARAIHNSSSRKDKLLVKVNCASLPANLIESELFGHERGAFTGAFEKRIGKFELANNGTLFLDEIGELPIELQAKLLRALQEKEIERIGGRAIIKCDVRIIAATNRKLHEEVKAQRFRSDLFFRLNIFPIRLPSLKDRKEDVPMLAHHFLQKFSKKMNKKIIGIENSSLQSLMTYQWPGNIRELENVIERAVIINNSKVLKIGLGDLGQQNQDFEQSSGNLNIFQVKSYKDAERELILKTLEISNGKIRGEGGAAQLLKINPTTLESKMKKLGLVKKNKIEINDD